MAPLPDQIGGYKVIQALGKGGMGAVFLAQDPVIGRLVAIKLLREGLDNPELRERFAREARSAGRLRHPNIVTLFHVGEHESQPYIVMEYIPGDTLADVVKQRLPLTVRRKLRIIEDLCRGMAHAHKSGVVHRDIKPANVLVDSEGIVKILDFGIARIGEQELTRLGMMMGTPNYMSPEQINPGMSDHRSDVFSVGLVFYELLAYKRAFPGDSFSVLHNIVNGEPEPIEASVPDLDPEIAAILRRTLQKNPDDRFQDIGTMRAELARVRGRLRFSSESDDGTDEGPITPTGDGGLTSDTPTIVAPPATEIEQHLALARQALEGRQFERALAECNLALALDANHALAIDLRRRARHELDLAACSEMLTAARSALADGRIATAIETLSKVEGLGLAGDTAAALLNQMTALRQEIDAAREKASQARAAVEQGRAQLKAGNLDAARRAADDASSAAPDDGEVKALHREVAAAVADRDRQAEEEKQRREQAAQEQQKRDEAFRRAKLEEAATQAPVAGRISDETVVLKRAPAPVGTAAPSAEPPPHPTPAADTLAAVAPPAPSRMAASPAPPPRVTPPTSSGPPGDRKFPWTIAAAAGIMILIGAIVWMVRSGGDRNTAQTATTIPVVPTTTTVLPTASPAATTTPPITPAQDPQVAALQKEVTAVLDGGDAGRAARLLNAAPARVQSDPAIQRDVDQVVAIARNAAARAEQQVPRAGTSSNDYRQGVQQQRQGDSFAKEGRKVDAATAFLEAAQLFTRAASSSQVAAATTSVPLPTGAATSSVAATTTVPQPAVPQPAAPQPAPPQPAAPQPAPPQPAATTSVPVPAGPTPAQDTAAIQNVLQQFVNGYQALDLAAIRRVFPSVTANFRDVRTYELELIGVQIQLQGDRASVTCRRRVRQTGTSGRPNESVVPTVFSMRRDPTGWIIEGVK